MYTHVSMRARTLISFIKQIVANYTHSALGFFYVKMLDVGFFYLLRNDLSSDRSALSSS